MTSPDWSATSDDYARHRQGFPPRFFELIAREGLFAPAMRVLDLGTGTGVLARALAARGGDVLGLDPAPGQVAAARRLAAAQQLPVRFEEGLAERTGQPDSAFDLVVAAQAWHWFARMDRGTGFYPGWAADLELAGFARLAFAGFDHDALYPRADWLGRIRASAGVGGALDAGAVARFEAELAVLLAARFLAEPLVVPHRVFAIWAFRD